MCRGGRILYQTGEAFHAPVTEAEASPRQTDLAEHGGQRDRGPNRLLAMIAALQRPVDVDEGSRRGHPAREAANPVGRNFAQAGGPVCSLRDTVFGAEKIIAEATEAGAVAREEVSVVQAFDDQRVRERQHQRGIAMRPRRNPLGVEVRGSVIAHRTDIAELDACRLDLLEPTARRMLADPAGSHLRVAGRHSAEHHNQVRMIGDALPTGARAVHRLHTAEYVLDEDDSCRVAVGVARAGESADAAEEALQLRARMMKFSGAAPSVGAGVDCVVTAIANDAFDFAGYQVERAIPADGNVTIGATAFARAAGAVLEPSRANRRLRDATVVIDSVGNRAQQGGRIRILRERPRFRHASVGNDRLERTPMRTVQRGRII